MSHWLTKLFASGRGRSNPSPVSPVSPPARTRAAGQGTAAELDLATAMALGMAAGYPGTGNALTGARPGAISADASDELAQKSGDEQGCGPGDELGADMFDAPCHDVAPEPPSCDGAGAGE